MGTFLHGTVDITEGLSCRSDRPFLRHHRQSQEIQAASMMVPNNPAPVGSTLTLHQEFKFS